MNLELIDYDRLVLNDVEGSLKKCLALNKEKDSTEFWLLTRVNTAEDKYKNEKEKVELLKLGIENKSKKKGNGLVWGASGFSLGVLLTIVLTSL